MYFLWYTHNLQKWPLGRKIQPGGGPRAIKWQQNLLGWTAWPGRCVHWHGTAFSSVSPPACRYSLQHETCSWCSYKPQTTAQLEQPDRTSHAQLVLMFLYCLQNWPPLPPGVHKISQKSRNYLQIVGTRRLTRGKFQNGDQQSAATCDPQCYLAVCARCVWTDKYFYT